MTNGFKRYAEDIFSFEGTPSICKSGDNSGEATPVPISNTEVKLLSADDTWWEAAWESRTLPVFFMRIAKAMRFFFTRQRLYFPKGRFPSII